MSIIALNGSIRTGRFIRGFGMGTESNYYQIIKEILSECRQTAHIKEEIKAKIVDAIGGADYISAITAYLWGAYNNFDSAARTAFKEIFFDDLRVHNPAAFYFFSFFFLNDFKRTGFDRRNDNDRRNSYSLDFFCEKVLERRQGNDRRKNQEKRVNWTRVTKWVSVPFKGEGDNLLGNGEDSAMNETLRLPDHPVPCRMRFRPDEEIDIRTLNAILYSLILYFEVYIRQGQTDWLKNLDEGIFDRAKEVMKSLIER
jgi:hypothetical protein